MALKTEIRGVLDQSLSVAAADSFASHTIVIDHTITLITDVGDASNLTLDADVDSYLTSIVVVQSTGIDRGSGAQARGSAPASPPARRRRPNSSRHWAGWLSSCHFYNTR